MLRLRIVEATPALAPRLHTRRMAELVSEAVLITGQLPATVEDPIAVLLHLPAVTSVRRLRTVDRTAVPRDRHTAVAGIAAQCHPTGVEGERHPTAVVVIPCQCHRMAAAVATQVDSEVVVTFPPEVVVTFPPEAVVTAAAAATVVGAVVIAAPADMAATTKPQFLFTI